LRRSEWSPSRLATIAIGLVAITSSFAIVLALKSKSFDMLYTGAPVEMAAKSVETLEADK